MSKREDLAHFLARLGDWAGRDATIHGSFADSIRRAIQSGDLIRGDRLPSERGIARACRVSRTTVIRAFEELRTMGLIDTRAGSGSVITALQVRRRAGRATRAASKLAPGTGRRHGADTVDLSSTSFDAPAEIARILRDHGESLLLERSYWPQGLPELRAKIAVDYSRMGLATTAEQILITNGAQQAIALVAAVELTQGDRVIIEEPSYFGAIDAYSGSGARLISVRYEGNDIDVAALEKLIASTGARVLHLSPTFQNPTGIVLSERSREKISRIADRTGIVVVEDDTTRELWFEREPPPPIAMCSRRDRVISIGSFSKTVWSGLRVGWMRLPLEEVGRYVACKAACDLGTSTLSQQILLMVRPNLAALTRQRATYNHLGCRLMIRELKRWLPAWTSTTPAGGAFLWVHVPNTDTKVLQQVAMRHGVTYTDGDILSATATGINRIRLSFSHEPPDIETGIRRLADAWKVLRARHERQ